MNKKLIEGAIDKVMIGLQERRERLGMVGLSEANAELRARAIDTLPPDAFSKLLAVEDDEARERQILALENAQRRSHAVAEIRAVARSIYDDRVLYRWFCACGEQSIDYFSAENALNGWGKHAGWLANGARNCKQCGESFTSNNKRDRFCSAACRMEAQHGS